MARPKQNVDWEEQLASIIERSDRNLSQLNAEFHSVKSNRLSGQQTMPRSSVKPRHAERVEGMYERAAYEAFNTAITRPASRSSENDLMRKIELKTRQTVERALNDKLTSTSRAIDALRDQISGVTDEIRELNTTASQTKRCLSTQEHRLDVMCHDVDMKRGALNDIEAHVANEISVLKKELTSSIESSKRNHKTAMTSLLRGTIQSELDKALAEELLSVEKHCIRALDSKIDRVAKSLRVKSEERMEKQQNDMVEIIKAIIVESLSVLEKNLRLDLTKKLEAKCDDLKNDILSSSPKATNEDVIAIQETVATLSNDVSLFKDIMKQPSTQIDVISIRISEFDERMNSLQTSLGKNDADIMSAFDYLSQHKDLIKAMNDRFVTKEDVQNIVDENDNIFDGRADDFVDTQTMKSELDSFRLEVLQNSSTQSSDMNGKLLEVQTAVKSLAGSVENIEKRADVQEDDFKRRLNVMLDVVESFEGRIRDLEDKSESKEILSEFQEALSTSKADIMSFINDTKEQTKSEISLLRDELASISQQLCTFSDSKAHVDRSYQDNVTTSPEKWSVNKEEDNLTKALSNLHTTLIDTKELGNDSSQLHSAVSIIASQKPVLGTPSVSHKTAEVKIRKPDESMSPCVHLLGLGSPCSVSTADRLPIPSPQKVETTSSNEEADCVVNESTSVAKKGTNDANTPRSESTSPAAGSILTEDALSLCGEVVNLSYCSDADEGGLEISISSRDAAISPADATEPLNQSSVLSRLTHKDFHCRTYPSDDSSSILGSITSFDECESISNLTLLIHDSRQRPLSINTVDNDVYEKWEFVLAELRATMSAEHIEEHNIVNESGTLHESSFESDD